MLGHAVGTREMAFIGSVRSPRLTSKTAGCIPTSDLSRKAPVAVSPSHQRPTHTASSGVSLHNYFHGM